MLPIARRQKVTRVLEGAVLANLFFEASTRTRVSFGAAFCRLGGSVCDTTGFTFSSMAKGESIHDTSRVIAGYADAIVVRHPEQGAVAEFARATNVPVVNGGDGPGEHPTQALLDLYTIQREFSRLGKRVDGAHVALVDRVCKPDVVVMHPLPRDSRAGAHDLATDLDGDPRLAIFRQTDNGIPVRMAIFASLLGVDGLVQRSMRNASWTPPVHIGPEDSLVD